MKKIFESLKKTNNYVKELKKTDKGKAILFFGFYFVFFLVIAVFARSFSGGSYQESDNYTKKDKISFDMIEKANYKFYYNIQIDNTVYNYSGLKKDDKELFTYSVDTFTLEYYKRAESYFNKENDIWIKSDNPYLFREFLSIDSLNNIFVDATYISKEEFDNGEVIYNYMISTNSIIKKLENINTDIDEIPNTFSVVANSSGDVYKIEMNLNSYGKYKGICFEEFSIILNYSDFNNSSEIVSPID